jgi:hypothetical protein
MKKMESVKSDDGAALPGVALLNDLQRIHQLVHEPVEFTDLPRRRYAFWPDRQSASAEHAVEAADAQQVAALQLLSEGAAFRRYGTAISIQDKLKILGGQYCDDVVCEPGRAGRPHDQVLGHLARLAQQMLSSWLGAPAAPLKQT